MKFQLFVELPFWINLENDLEFTASLSSSIQLKFTLRQDFWELSGVEKYSERGFVKEIDLINRHTLDFKVQINNYTNSKYQKRKLKTVLEIIYQDADKVNNDVEWKAYLAKLKNTITTHINRFLSFYSNCILNSNHPFIQIIPLNEQYFSYSNTIIHLWDAEEQDWVLFKESINFLSGIFSPNFPAIVLNEEATKYLQDQFQQDTKELKGESRCRERICHAYELRDMNSLIIQLCILLESKIYFFLEKKRKFFFF